MCLTFKILMFLNWLGSKLYCSYEPIISAKFTPITSLVQYKRPTLPVVFWRVVFRNRTGSKFCKRHSQHHKASLTCLPSSFSLTSSIFPQCQYWHFWQVCHCVTAFVTRSNEYGLLPPSTVSYLILVSEIKNKSTCWFFPWVSRIY